MVVRVCFVSLLAYPLFNSSLGQRVIGGAEINMYLLATKLSEDPKYEVSFLVDDFGQSDIEFIHKIRVIKYSGDNHCNNLIQKLLRDIIALHQLFTIDADIFIYTAASSFLGKLVIIEKYLRRKKIIFRLSSDRNLDFAWYKNTFGRKYATLYKFGLLRVNSIVCQTTKQKTLLAGNTGLCGNVIPNGFPIGNSISVQQKSSILWVSRCMPLKRPHLFLDLAEKLPEENFVMIMPQNHSDNQQIDQQIRNLYQEIENRIINLKNVELVGYVPYEKIQKYFDHAKVFVCTSQLEGFPNTFIQSCLGGTCILSFFVDPDNIIQNNDLGYLCGADTIAASLFIRSLSKEKLEYYRQKTYNFIYRNHNLEKSVLSYKSLFNND